MILQCPSCSARFLVADALIPPAGRNVRCGACHSEWFVEAASGAPAQDESVDFAQLAEAAAREPETETPPLESAVAAQLPVITYKWPTTKPFKIAAVALAAAWLVTLLIAQYPNWLNAPLLSHLYAMAGVVDTDGIVFNEVKLERSEDGSKTKFVLAGSLANHATIMHRVPYVRVELKNKKGEVFWSRKYPVQHDMAPGEIYPFRITDVETSFANDVGTIVMDLGHSLQMAMR